MYAKKKEKYPKTFFLVAKPVLQCAENFLYLTIAYRTVLSYCVHLRHVLSNGIPCLYNLFQISKAPSVALPGHRHLVEIHEKIQQRDFSIHFPNSLTVSK